MGRKNNAARQRNSKGRPNRREKGGPRRERAPRAARVEAEALVIPDGTCLRNPRKPKARFDTEPKAAAALKQAQQMRLRTRSSHVEKRYYPCPQEEGGCGGYHLTSREAYEPLWKRGTA